MRVQADKVAWLGCGDRLPAGILPPAWALEPTQQPSACNQEPSVSIQHAHGSGAAESLPTAAAQRLAAALKVPQP